MCGSRPRLAWLVLMALGALMLVVTGCGVVAPAAPIDLVIMYTSDTKGIAASTFDEDC